MIIHWFSHLEERMICPMENSSLIEPIENFDPFARFLRKTLRLRPITFGIAILILGLFLDLWIGFHHNLWFSSDPSNPGLLQDFTVLTVDYFFNPMMAGLYLWSTEGPTQLFRKLQLSGIFESPGIVRDQIEKSRQVYTSRIILYVIASVSILLAVAQVAAYQGWVPWRTIGGHEYLDPATAFYRTPFWWLSFYSMFFIAYNTIVTIFILRGLFKIKGLHIVPLHPDRCGGMVSITQYTVKVAYGIAAAGLVLSAATILAIRSSTLDKTYPVILGNLLYVVFAPLLFFWPLGTAHTAMKEAKDARLLELSQRFNRIFERINARAEDDADTENDLKKLEDIKNFTQWRRTFQHGLFT